MKSSRNILSQSDPIYGTAIQILCSCKVAVMIVAYNAEKHIEDVLTRIPMEIAEYLSEIFVLDDSSNDHTYEKAIEAGKKLNFKNLNVFRTPMNMGYGGNQKIGYTYAIEREFDIVVMLHGDGQYPPEYLPQMIALFENDDIDVVLGSRMCKFFGALRGGMPFYKWIGNVILTFCENIMLQTQLTEFHTGYRAYRMKSLRQVNFRYNSDEFHFDTEILIQFISAGCKIAEISIPTYYGEEVCNVNGFKYAWNCLKSVIKYRLFRIGFFYNPFLDFNLFEEESYFFKKSPNSLHQYVLKENFTPDMSVVDLGSNKGYISAEIAKRVSKVVAVDKNFIKQEKTYFEIIHFDLNGEFDSLLGFNKFDVVLALDIIEHLEKPEIVVQKICGILKPGGIVIASTGNISFIIMRIMLLLGIFNYGKRGILDNTHKRLFTIYSFKHLFKTYGFKIEKVRGFGPPIQDLISSWWPFRLIDSILSFFARIMPNLFSYNFLLIARRLPTLEEVYDGCIKGNG